jgi:hypothetical protein
MRNSTFSLGLSKDSLARRLRECDCRRAVVPLSQQVQMCRLPFIPLHTAAAFPTTCALSPSFWTCCCISKYSRCSAHPAGPFAGPVSEADDDPPCAHPGTCSCRPGARVRLMHSIDPHPFVQLGWPSKQVAPTDCVYSLIQSCLPSSHREHYHMHMNLSDRRTRLGGTQLLMVQ